ncbi:hypothetical protein pb186bvf_001205 [Paramecium bursaria]
MKEIQILLIDNINYQIPSEDQFKTLRFTLLYFYLYILSIKTQSYRDTTLWLNLFEVYVLQEGFQHLYSTQTELGQFMN